MKKLLSLFGLALLMASCSQNGKVIFSGTISNPTPGGRIQVIDMTNPAPLPIADFGVDEKGNFSDTLEIPKNGMYMVAYGNTTGQFYLKGGDHIQVTGYEGIFPSEYTFKGKPDANNQFVTGSQAAIQQYVRRIGQEVIMEEEPKFLTSLKKYREDLGKKMDSVAQVTKADKAVVKWRKDELDVNLLLLSAQYDQAHGMMINKPDFKTGDEFAKYQKSLIGDETEKIIDYPDFRSFIEMKISKDFQDFRGKQENQTKSPSVMAGDFLKTTQLSSKAKDYMLAYMMSRYDMNLNQDNGDELREVAEKYFNSSSLKKEMLNVISAVYGMKIGSKAPQPALKELSGKAFSWNDLKGKPAVLIFYSSWKMIPAQFKDYFKPYEGKITPLFIGLDDNFKQGKDIAEKFMKDMPGTQLYATGGIQGPAAKAFHLYDFRIPMFLIVDKDGKIASKPYSSIMDPDLMTSLNKITGVVVPDKKEENNSPFPGIPVPDEQTK